jgi:hypothetical protein
MISSELTLVTDLGTCVWSYEFKFATSQSCNLYSNDFCLDKATENSYCCLTKLELILYLTSAIVALNLLISF